MGRPRKVPAPIDSANVNGAVLTTPLTESQTGTTQSSKSVSVDNSPLVSPETPPKNGKIASGPLAFSDRISKVESGMEKIMEKIEQLNHTLAQTMLVKANEVTSREVDSTIQASEEKRQVSEMSEAAEIVQKICGTGFETRVQAASPGISFKLIIVPPVHLREHADDQRVRIISNVDGLNGVRQYAELVRDFCLRWSNKHGVTYAKES